MGKKVISVEHLSKRYDLGVIGTGTVSRDLNRWWARMRGKPDPYAKIGEVDHGNRSGESIMALDDVSFAVEQGEVLGIIGRNGAGKSTLLKILSQVTAPSSGKIKVKGRIGSLLEVGTGFHPELTGRENVYLNGAILGMSRAEVDSKFDEIVDFSGVEKFIETPVKRYSSGMYVRLAFAVAAHLEPEILIVDEVLAVGDVEFQKKCIGKMSNVASQGRTVLFVSHNFGAISSLCGRCILLDRGHLNYSGSTIATISEYLRINEKLNLLKNESDFGSFHNTSISPEKISNKNSSLKVTGTLNLYRPIKNYNIYFVIQDEYTNFVVHSIVSEKQLEDKPLQIGKNTVEVLIPPIWLKPGFYTYHIKLIVGKGSDKKKIESSVLSFQVSYFEDKENMIGMVNPEIDWRINGK